MLLLVGFLGIAMVAYFLFGSSNPTTTPQGGSAINLVETTANAPGNSITIPRVVLSEPGFVMIHKSVNGQTGPIVMTGDYLPAGESTGVVVSGLQTQSGQKYYAMLHVDDGNEVYDSPAVDPPVYDDDGIVQEEFSIE